MAAYEEANTAGLIPVGAIVYIVDEEELNASRLDFARLGYMILG
jgi:hypothetical protein